MHRPPNNLTTALLATLIMAAGCATLGIPPTEGGFSPNEAQNAENLKPKARTLFVMGQMFAAKGKTAPAEQFFRQAIAEQEAFLPAYSDLAKLLVTSGKIDEALQIIENGLQHGPDSPVLLNNKGICLLLKKQYPDALATFQRAAAVSSSPLYRANEALALGIIGKEQEARSAFTAIMSDRDAEHNIAIVRTMRDPQIPQATVTDTMAN